MSYEHGGVVADLPMAKEMLSTCATLEPTVIRNLPGSRSSALVIVPCLTSTPFGTPVLPVCRGQLWHHVALWVTCLMCTSHKRRRRRRP